MAGIFMNPEGVKMEVSNDGIKWYKRIVCSKTNHGTFMALQPNRKSIVLFWLKCRNIQTKVEI